MTQRWQPQGLLCSKARYPPPNRKLPEMNGNDGLCVKPLKRWHACQPGHLLLASGGDGVQERVISSASVYLCCLFQKSQQVAPKWETKRGVSEQRPAEPWELLVSRSVTADELCWKSA